MDMAVVALAGLARQFFHGHDAAFQLAATDVFKLDGGVADEIVVAKDVIQLDQDAGTL